MNNVDDKTKIAELFTNAVESVRNGRTNCKLEGDFGLRPGTLGQIMRGLNGVGLQRFEMLRPHLPGFCAYLSPGPNAVAPMILNGVGQKAHKALGKTATLMPAPVTPATPKHTTIVRRNMPVDVIIQLARLTKDSKALSTWLNIAEHVEESGVKLSVLLRGLQDA